MKPTTYLFILVKSDSTSFKVGLSTNLDETVDYYQDSFKFKFRQDRSFLFSGDFNQMKNLYTLFTSLLNNYSLPSFLDEDLEDMFDIKALVLLNSFSETLDRYKIKTKKLSLKKTLEVCKPSLKIISRRNKINLLFDYNLLDTQELENKYNMSFEQLGKVYKDFLKDMYKPNKPKFRHYLKIYKTMNMMKEELIKVL